MAENTSSGKRKTLYGRYDDYAAPEGETAGGSRAVRLSDMPAPRRAGRGAGADRPKLRPEAGDTAGTGASGAPVESREPCESAASILRVVTDADGETLTVTLEKPGDGGTRLQCRIPLTVEQYAALNIQPGRLSAEAAERLEHAGALCLAIRKAGELLGYGDMSARTLVRKLTARGIDRTVAVEAADWLVTRGMLREDASALARALADARKGWGPRRIRQDLLAHGYPSEAADAALDTLNDPEDPAFVDFEYVCRCVLRTKLGRDTALLTDRAACGRLIAAMMRLGYESDTVRDAMRDALRESMRDAPRAARDEAPVEDGEGEH